MSGEVLDIERWKKLRGVLSSRVSLPSEGVRTLPHEQRNPKHKENSAVFPKKGVRLPQTLLAGVASQRSTAKLRPDGKDAAPEALRHPEQQRSQEEALLSESASAREKSPWWLQQNEQGQDKASEVQGHPIQQVFPEHLLCTWHWDLLSLKATNVKLMSIESVMSSNHLILCFPLLLLHSVFPSSRVSFNESDLLIR